jgi:hypothetical protein
MPEVSGMVFTLDPKISKVHYFGEGIKRER